MSDPTPKKRATVAGVDKKIDDLVEIVDIMSTNVRQIKAALELIAEVVKSLTKLLRSLLKPINAIRCLDNYFFQPVFSYLELYSK